jgi:hypothetical protein
MKLWVSKPEAFNDPFDCGLEITKAITEEDVLYAIKDKYGERSNWPQRIAKYVDSIFDVDGTFTPKERRRVDNETEVLLEENKNSGVLCLCEVNDSILMWSHYAMNHTGICIEYERKPGTALADPELCSPVQYGSTYPAIDLGKMLVHRSGQTMDLMMRFKAASWSYEKEWRLITDEGNKPHDLPGPISKVIFGLRTPKDFRRKVQRLCDKRGIRTVQAFRAPMEFRIEIPS